MSQNTHRYVSGSTSRVRLLTGTLVALGAVLAAAVWPAAQVQSPSMELVVGRNVNIVAGQTLPNGDPYLQRQNEPSVAASTRNPLHLLAGSNDYRTVDIPGMPDDGETGDAWLGVFKSFDGGERWQSGLLPGYPQDTSAEGMASPLKGYHAGADPVVRPGTNGLLYYSGLVFNRGEGGESAIFVSRFVDNNNKENGDPIAYISTAIVAKSTGKEFLDKPWMAVDVPRAGAKVCRINTQQAAPQLTAAAQERLAKSGKGASGAAVSAAATTIKNTRTTKGTPAVLPTPGVAQVTGTTTTVSQQVLAGTMYVAYAAITTTTLATGEKDVTSRIMFSRSDDCGATWSRPVQISDPLNKVNQGAAVAVDPTTGLVHVAWRQFGLDAASPDAIMSTTVDPATRAVRKPRKVHEFATRRKADNLSVKLQRAHRLGEVKELVSIKPFDSDTTEERFRTNAYPSMAIDDESRVYLAWTERGFGGRPLVDQQGNPLRDDNGVAMDPAVHGDARVVVSTSRAGGIWTPPQPVDTGNFAGHQMMPSVAYAGGRLMIVYYDLRQDISQVFGTFVDEFDAVYSANKRHTIDVRVVQAPKADVPVFGGSTMVSQYLMGNLRGSRQVQQLQFNAPNLPLFQLGTVPFMGDYIDIAPAPAFVQNADGRWIHNTANTSAPVFHTVWTDNRDVQKPADGDWKNYTPPGGATCAPGQTGMRNQNVYSARITMGLVAGSPSNTKPLDATTPRSFVVFAQNATYEAKAFRLTIENQPVGGQASFNQLGLLEPLPLMTTVDVKVAPRSMVARTVYATSSNPKEQVRVQVTEIDFEDFTLVPSGLATKVILNPDISNPDISNPDISNPDISNPDISNAEVYNPDISNPDISNPDISNPDISNPDISNPDISNIVIANPDISNPDISNPDISNPDISNPDISNPDISNPDISNGSLTDVTWTIRNDGNTTASFNVNLFLANQSATTGGIKTQLVVHKTYKTPVSDGCVLKSQTQTVLVAKVDDPVFLNAGQDPTFDPANPDISNTTLWLEPGGEGKITLRIVDPDPTDAVEINPVEDITPVITAQPINTPDLRDPTPEPPATPLPTDPPAPPSPTETKLSFVTQPANTLAGGPIPDVIVRALIGGNPAPGVQVTIAIAINPSGGKLGGVVTVLTDAAGLATFGGLSIDRDGVGYRLSASAAAAEAMPILSDAFGVGAVVPPPPPPAAAWSATGDGIVALVDNGLVSGTPRMTYQRNGIPNFNGAWTLSSVAGGAGAARLDWEWTGFHSYCRSSVQLQSFVNRGGFDVFTAPLVQYADNCVGANNPSAGFAFAGVTSVVVQAGDTYGFRLAGSHGDGTYALEGTFTAVVNGATNPSPFVVTNASDGGPGSLRAALIAANAAADLNTITFAIPGAWVHHIAPATPLPVITTPVIIDGLSQPGAVSMAPMINLDGRFMLNFVSDNNDDQPGTNLGLAPGFEVAASDVTIRGLGINRFPGPGVYVNNGTNNVRVEDNAIGAGVTGVMTWPANNVGVHLNYSTNHVIARNVISNAETSGILIAGGSGTVITGNRIGMSADGLTALPNLDNGITLYNGATATIIDGNLISGNGTIGGANGFGIDIQHSGGLAPVSGTIITNNTIGLDANGDFIARGAVEFVNLAGIPQGVPVDRGNAGGGIRLNRGTGTIIGQAGAGNTISGNRGTGVIVSGAVAVAPVLRNNRIGTDSTGMTVRSNARGVEVFGSAATIGAPGAGNGNVISGNVTDGIFADGNTTIENNRLGVDATGTGVLGNGNLYLPDGPDAGTFPDDSGCCHANVFVNAPNNVIRGNVVGGSSGHPQNPGIRSGGAAGQAPNLIEDNFVGTDAGGTVNLANGIGIGLYGDRSGTVVRRNLVAFNQSVGIWLVEGTQGALIGDLVNFANRNIVRDNAGTGVGVGYNGGAVGDTNNAIAGNLIFRNGGLGIDLGGNGVTGNDAGDGDAGPNNFNNFPVLANANNAGVVTTVDFTLDTLSINSNHYIEVYVSATCDPSTYGEGETLVGSLTQMTDGAGDAFGTIALASKLGAGTFLTAIVSGPGGTSEFSQCVVVPAPVAPNPFIVTNTSDAGLGSLRYALTEANATPGLNTISFNIPGPGPHTIALTSPLPTVGDMVSIDGRTQPGYDNRPMVRVDGTGTGGARGFELQAESEILGLSITGFTDRGVLVLPGGANSVIQYNHIGTDRSAAGGMGNGFGVALTYTTGVAVLENLISGNSVAGVQVLGGTANEIRSNQIGTGLAGLGILPNRNNGVTLYDGADGTIIDGNLISGNGTVGQPNGFGIDIQQSGASIDVKNTVITNNIIGLDAAGNLINRGGGDYIGTDATNYGNVNRGNSGGGIRVVRGSRTQIGQVGAGNTISGNTVSGVVVTGPTAEPVKIVGNRIGTDQTGSLVRANTLSGVVADSPGTLVGGSALGEANVISGNLGDGVSINAANVVVQGNFIGTTGNGLAALGNGPELQAVSVGNRTGIKVGAVPGVVIGGVAPGARNIVSGNRLGIVVYWDTTNIRIEGNYIGTDITGNAGIPNGANGQGEGGILLLGGNNPGGIGSIISFNRIMFNTGYGGGIYTGTGPQAGLYEGNVIAFNTGAGIVLRGGPVNGEPLASARFKGNLIYGNTGVGIDLGGDGRTLNDVGDGDIGSNFLQNFPVLSAAVNAGPATTVNVTLDSQEANTNHTIEIFASAACDASGFGEGERLVGSFVQMSDGAGDFSVVGAVLSEPVPAGQFLTATATNGSGFTSEFSQCVQVVQGVTITSASPSNGKSGEGFLVFRGSNLPFGFSSGDVVAEVTSGAATANGFWFSGASSPTAAYVRLPGLPLGPATVRLRNNAGTIVTNAFPITITAVPGTPEITAIRDGSLNVVAAPVAAGSTIYVGAYGTDTLGAVVRFTQGGNTWDVAAGTASSNDVLGLVVQVSLPGAAASGPIDVSIRQGASAFSAPVTIQVAAPPSGSSVPPEPEPSAETTVAPMLITLGPPPFRPTPMVAG